MNEQSRAGVDFSRSAIARYIQLAMLFRRRIESGQWPVGSQIPTVDELADECGVARATIRQALDILHQEKLIERFRAKGTFVRAHPSEQLWCEVATDWSGLLRPRADATIEILSEEADVQVEPSINEKYGAVAPAYRHYRRRHWRHEKPFLLADVYLDERLSHRVTDEALRSKTALRLIHDVAGVDIADTRQILTIGTADVETADQLMMPINAPVAFVHRIAVDRNGIIVLIADGIYRGDVVRIDVTLK